MSPRKKRAQVSKRFAISASVLILCAAGLASDPALAWRGAGFGGFRAGGFARFGGFHAERFGGFHGGYHRGYYGGEAAVAHGPRGGEAAAVEGPRGGEAAAVKGPMGGWHAGGVGAYGGTWHADGYHPGGVWGGAYGYHGATVVNSYYAHGCVACAPVAVGAAGAAGAAVAGAAVAAATGPAVGVAVETPAAPQPGAEIIDVAPAAAAPAVPPPSYAVGSVVVSLPAGCKEQFRNVGDVSYVICGDLWFRTVYGNNGLYYKVVQPVADDRAAILQACAGDIERLCAGVAPGEGRIKACVKRHVSELSAGCFDSLLKLLASEKEPG